MYLGTIRLRIDRALNIYLTIVTHNKNEKKALDSRSLTELERLASKAHVRLSVEHITQLRRSRKRGVTRKEKMTG
jgi:hypothetical protein